MEFVESLQNALPTYVNVFIAIFRYLAPLLAVVLLIRAGWPLLSFRREPEIWAWLDIDGDRTPITHWENVIGSRKDSDVVLDKEGVSPCHAVLTRYDDGSWTVADADTPGGVRVNGKKVQIRALREQDVISIAGVKMTLEPISRKQEQRLAQLRTRASSFTDSILNLSLLTFFQILCCIGFLMTGAEKDGLSYLIGFGGIIALQWSLFGFYGAIRRPAFEVECIAFFLCTMGMNVISTIAPGEAAKQTVAIALGIVVFVAVGWSLRNLERAKIIRYVAAVAGIVFLLATLVFGTQIQGATNWIYIGGISLQPSELSKLCFVFVGASAMDRIVTRRNLFLFIGYSVAMCFCLALMRDFGAALIFFASFLIVAYMRSGSVGTIALACTGLGVAGVMVTTIAPHVLSRFSSWRHIWELPYDGGWQQTHVLSSMTSGGLFGMGMNQGWLSGRFDADSDMVMGTVGEEWGLLMVAIILVSILLLGFFSVRCASVGRSSFYVIGSCTAAGILLTQAILNALGTLDIIPMTGVTFPFVSNGGSSMLCVWGLLGFIKAADTRQNASFAVRLVKRGGDRDE